MLHKKYSSFYTGILLIVLLGVQGCGSETVVQDDKMQMAQDDEDNSVSNPESTDEGSDGEIKTDTEDEKNDSHTDTDSLNPGTDESASSAHPDTDSQSDIKSELDSDTEIPQCDGEDKDCFDDCWGCAHQYHCTDEIAACRANVYCNTVLTCRQTECCNPNDPTDCLKGEEWKECLATCDENSLVTSETADLLNSVVGCIGCDACAVSCAEVMLSELTVSPHPPAELSCDAATNEDACQELGCCSLWGYKVNATEHCVESEPTFVACETCGQCATLISYAIEPGTGDCYMFGCAVTPKGWEDAYSDDPACGMSLDDCEK